MPGRPLSRPGFFRQLKLVAHSRGYRFANSGPHKPIHFDLRAGITLVLVMGMKALRLRLKIMNLLLPLLYVIVPVNFVLAIVIGLGAL